MNNKLDKSIRNQKIIESFQQGTSVSDLVLTYNLTKQSIYNILKSANKSQNGINLTLGIEARNIQIRKEFEKGSSMPELALKYQMTRQGIQLILKNQGIDRKQGGAAVRAKLKKEKEQSKKFKHKQKACLNKWGCTLEQWQTLRDYDENFHKTPIARFIQHRSNVLRDAIPWKLTLWQWWTIWSQSGHYQQRGRGKTAYCMTRKNDNGIYEVENVQITTISENLKQGFSDRTSTRKQVLIRQGRMTQGNVKSCD